MSYGADQLRKHGELIIKYVNFPELKFQSKGANEKWEDTESPNFLLDREYRIKPEPKLTPFTFDDRDQFRGKWIRRKSDKAEFCPSEIYRKSLYFQSGNCIDYKEMMEKFEFLDGSPCGKLIQE